MAWSIVQAPACSVNTSTGKNAQTAGPPAASTTPGNSIFIFVWGYAQQVPSAIDSAGNSYGLDVLQAYLPVSGYTANAAILSAHNTQSVAAVTGSFTVQVQSNSGYLGQWGFFVVEAQPSSLFGVFDQGAVGAVGVAGTPSSGATPPVFGGPELVMGLSVFTAPSGNTTTVAGPWTKLFGDAVSSPGQPTIFGVAAYQAVTASGQYTFNGVTFSGGAVGASCALCAVYRDVLPLSVVGHQSIVSHQAVRRAASY